MKTSRGLWALITLAASVLWGLWPGQAAAEEQGSLSLGGFQVGGSVEAGWRLVDIDGSRDRYKEVVNLFDGPRLFDLNLWSRSSEGSGLADFFSFTANGIGDPFPFARLQIKKDKAYDLAAVYREYR